jgi:hypothetical protein
MDTTTMIYQEMNRSIIVELEDRWGKEKFQEWYEETIVPLNGKVEVTPQLYHQILESELHYDYAMMYSDELNERHDQLMEQQDLRGGL